MTTYKLRCPQTLRVLCLTAPLGKGAVSCLGPSLSQNDRAGCLFAPPLLLPAEPALGPRNCSTYLGHILH